MAFEFTDANFAAKAHKGVTVIDFWAEWCGPCKMIGPIVEELAHEYDGKALVGKMDVDNNQEIPLQYGVRAIPTIIFLKDGKLVGLLGGDHSTPLGFIRALSERYDRFGILQIDAHADLRKAYEGFTYSHASIMYNALKIPAVHRLVQVGIRDFC